MVERGCKTVGIDLGTTFSSLAYIDSQGVPRIVADAAGRTTMPSIVCFDDAGVFVGHDAYQAIKRRADRIVQFVKLRMGEPWSYEFDGHRHSPESVSALILKQLVTQSEPTLGPIERAVVTVPAYFTEKRRFATQQAGEIAGLVVAGTLNEPMAATLAYGLYRGEQDRNVVIYDLGGGTFDVTVAHVAPDRIEELAISGNRQLGGRDWDTCLVDLAADDFRRVHGVDPRSDEATLTVLRMTCEVAKRALSRSASHTLKWQGFERDHSIEISREQFEATSEFLVETTRSITESAVAESGLRWNQIDRVVLVGGSTFMPAIRKMIRQLTGKPPDTGVNPVLAVSLGAAIYAEMLDSGRPFETKALEQVEKAMIEPQLLDEPSSLIVPSVDEEPSSLELPPFNPSVVAPPVVPFPANILPVPPPLPASHFAIPQPQANSAPASVSPPPLPIRKSPWSMEPVPASPRDDEGPVDDLYPPTIAYAPRESTPLQAEPFSAAFAPPQVFQRPPKLPCIRFSTSHGIGVLVRRESGYSNVVLIPKNSPVPVSSSRRFFTESTEGIHTNIRITVTQGDTTDSELVEILGEGRIVGLPPGKHGERPVDLVVEFDDQARLKLHALYVDTGHHLEMAFDVRGGLQQQALESHRRVVARTPLINPAPAADITFVEPDDDWETDEFENV